MTANDDAPSNDRFIDGAFVHDSAWELPELAPVMIILSVGLLVAGSGIETGMSFVGQTGFPAGLGWSFIVSALRWIDPSTSTMLLISAALIWWQFGYWSAQGHANASDAIVSAHIARLRVIAKWNLAAFAITVVSVIVLIVASILQNAYSGAVLQIWADSIETICMALGTLGLSLLGIVALRRILTASRMVEDDL